MRASRLAKLLCLSLLFGSLFALSSGTINGLAAHATEPFAFVTPGDEFVTTDHSNQTFEVHVTGGVQKPSETRTAEQLSAEPGKIATTITPITIIQPDGLCAVWTPHIGAYYNWATVGLPATLNIGCDGVIFGSADISPGSYSFSVIATDAGTTPAVITKTIHWKLLQTPGTYPITSSVVIDNDFYQAVGSYLTNVTGQPTFSCSTGTPLGVSCTGPYGLPVGSFAPGDHGSFIVTVANATWGSVGHDLIINYDVPTNDSQPVTSSGGEGNPQQQSVVGTKDKNSSDSVLSSPDGNDQAASAQAAAAQQANEVAAKAAEVKRIAQVAEANESLAVALKDPDRRADLLTPALYHTLGVTTVTNTNLVALNALLAKKDTASLSIDEIKQVVVVANKVVALSTMTVAVPAQISSTLKTLGITSVSARDLRDFASKFTAVSPELRNTPDKIADLVTQFNAEVEAKNLAIKNERLAKSAATKAAALAAIQKAFAKSPLKKP